MAAIERTDAVTESAGRQAAADVHGGFPSLNRVGLRVHICLGAGDARAGQGDFLRLAAENLHVIRDSLKERRIIAALARLF